MSLKCERCDSEHTIRFDEKWLCGCCAMESLIAIFGGCPVEQILEFRRKLTAQGWDGFQGFDKFLDELQELDEFRNGGGKPS